MKKERILRLLPPSFLLLGLLAWELQNWLYGSYVEDPVSGLLPWFTLPEILLWALTIAAIAAAFFLPRGAKMGQCGKITGALSQVFFAAGVLTLLLEPLKGPAGLVLICKVFCVITALCLAASAVMQLLGKTPFFLLTVAPCVLCVLQLLEYYQSYSEVPQLMNYIFGLGAVLCLVLSAYHRMARAAGLPDKRWHYSVGLLAEFFCVAAVAQGEYAAFFCAAAVWMLAEMSRLRPEEESE